MFRCLIIGDSDFDYLFKIFSADFPIAKLLFYTLQLIGTWGRSFETRQILFLLRLLPIEASTHSWTFSATAAFVVFA